MSGHSKWASIKHQKAIKDSRRGQAFTKLSRAITVAAKAGGGDVDGNPSLALAVQKAKDASMPKDNIQRAIDKGTGAGADAESFEEIMYEGYGPGGVALLIEALTNNRNRTGGEVRNIFTKAGCALAEPGAVAYLFDKKGVVIVETEHASEDDLMVAIDAGAEDIVAEEDHFEIVCEPSDFQAVRKAIEGAGIAIASGEVLWRPQVRTEVDEETAGKLFRLLEKLDENDDVGEVHGNFSVDDDVMERLAG
ncbi:MAG: YebC/PmpR family DNA-binding transcriptional regulator [Solirubrobacterales bacterium]|nr:YebC/PmpR family DNA-binding transcriptional regulator [Solirubrobacterales bacterium]